MVLLSFLLLPSDLTGLARFAANALALEDYPLTQVGLGLLQLAYLRGHLAHCLLVDARHAEAGRRIDVEAYAGQGLHPHRVREAEREDQRGAVLGDAVAHARNLQVLRETVGYAGHHVSYQRAGQAMERPVRGSLRRARDNNLSV